MTAARNGQYRLAYKLIDDADHMIEGGYMFTVMGDGFDGRDYRFNNLELIPDQAEYQAGDLDWEDLDWVQGIYGAETGLCQVWVRSEIQLVPEAALGAVSDAHSQPVPFFGSEAIYRELHR